MTLFSTEETQCFAHTFQDIHIPQYGRQTHKLELEATYNISKLWSEIFNRPVRRSSEIIIPSDTFDCTITTVCLRALPYS